METPSEEALERKRRLGQYAVILHEGRIVKLMPDGSMVEFKEYGNRPNPRKFARIRGYSIPRHKIPCLITDPGLRPAVELWRGPERFGALRE